MIAFRRGPRPKLLLCLLLITSSISAGCVRNLQSETSPAGDAGWKIRFDGSDSNPVITDGVLYVGSADGAVYALDATSGATRWRFQTGEGLSSGPQIITIPRSGNLPDVLEKARAGKRSVDLTPMIWSGTVFIGSGDFSLYALDAVTGRKQWSYEAGSKIFRAAINNEGSAYLITEEGLHALDARTGRKRWLFQTLQDIPVHPLNPDRRPAEGMALGESAIFVTAWGWSTLRLDAAPKSFLYAVAPESGMTKWVTTLAGVGITAPAAAKGRIFVAVGDPHARSSTSYSDHKTLYAINAADGEVRWKLGADVGWTSARLLIAGDMIYLYTDRRLLAVELETGRQLWAFSAEEIYSQLIADDQHLYVVTHKGSYARPSDTLHALARTTGQQKWSQELSGGAYVSMVHEGVIYAGQQYLYAIDAATGKTLWSFRGTGRESARLTSGGRIFLISPTVTYLGSRRVDQGYLYAIDAKTGKP